MSSRPHRADLTISDLVLSQGDPAALARELAIDADHREFLLVLRRALLLIVAFIERRYGLTRDS